MSNRTKINKLVEEMIADLPKVEQKTDDNGKAISMTALQYMVHIITNSKHKIIAHAGRIWVYYKGTYIPIESKARTENFIMECVKKIDSVQYVSAKTVANILIELFMQYYELFPVKDPEVTYINMLSNVLAVHKNGRIELLKHDEKYNFTYQLGFDYDSQAKCPVFDRFMQTSLADPDLIDVIGEFFGYVLNTNSKNYEKALMLYGDGSNGKSTLINIAKHLFGKENISVVELTEMGDMAKTALMEGKLLNVSSDTKSKGLDTSAFKKIVSGEPVLGKYLWKDVYTIENLPKIVIALNKLPFHNGDNSGGFYRRFLLIPYSIVIQEEDKDYELESKVVKNELPAILNFAIEGMRRLAEQGSFTESKSMIDAMNSFKESTNHVATFIEEEQYEEVSPESKTGTKLVDLYQDFNNWCRERGHNPYNANYLSAELTHIGYVGYKNSSKHFRIVKRKLENETGFKVANRVFEKSPYEKEEE